MTNCLAQLLTPGPLAAAVAGECAPPDAAGRLEELVVSDRVEALPLLRSQPWRRFRADVRRVFEENDYAILRGLPAVQDGAALLMAALTLAWKIHEAPGLSRDTKASVC